MSTYFTFNQLSIARTAPLQDPPRRQFQISIHNDKHKEAVIFRAASTGNSSQFQRVPKNLFLLPDGEKIRVLVEEVTEEGDDIEITGLRIEKQLSDSMSKNLKYNKSKVDIRDFVVQEQNWRFTFQYQMKHQPRLQFAGHFIHVLKTQEAKKGQNMSEGQRYRLPKPFKTNEWPTGKQLSSGVSDQNIEDDDQNSIEAPKYFPSQLDKTNYSEHKSYLEGKSSAIEAEITKNLKEINEEPESSVYSLSIKGKKTKKMSLSSRPSFYLGPCKNKNLFSCLDPATEEGELHIIEPFYS